MQPTDKVTVSVPGEMVITTAAQAMDVATQLVENYRARHGTTVVPSFTGEPMPLLVATVTPVAKAPIGFSPEGAARSATDRAIALDAGFTPADPLYTAGTRVVQLGVDNARQARAEWEAMPNTRDACGDLVAKVKSECRHDQIEALGTLRMAKDGRIAIGSDRVSLTPRALSGLVTRMGCGGLEYLRDACTPELRAINVNHQVTGLAKNIADTRVTLRTRDGRNDRSVFAIVSESYTAHDVDMVAAQVARGVHADCRGSIAYDGQRYRIEALLHSTVQPENFVAGEFFRAGVIVSGDDTGSGSIRVSACVWQNLCLNLIVIDESTIETGRFVHKGSTRGIAAGIAKALEEASEAIDGFRDRWGFASVESVVTSEQLAMGREIAAMGIFRGLLDREMVKIPGRTEDIVKGLAVAFAGDQSSATRSIPVSRAAIVNAVTQYAHRSVGDPWTADQISRDAGRILASSKALPFEAE